jgi:hypothetical protein
MSKIPLQDFSLISLCDATNNAKLYSIVPDDGSGDFTAARNSTATYVGADGLIKTAVANEPRIEFNPDGSYKGLLVEPQRTNLVFPSDVATTQTRTVTAAAHTLSFYGTGQVVLSGVATGTLTGTGANERVTLTFTPTAGSLVLTVTGSVTLWQLEAASTASSYIPTVASTVTRVADVVSKTGASSLIGQTEGTLYAEVDLSNFESSGRILVIGDGTNNNIINLLVFTSNRFRLVVRTNGSGQVAVNSQTYTAGVFKIAVAYAENDFVFYVNGDNVDSSASGIVPNCSDVYLGTAGDGTTNPLNDRIKAVALLPTRLSNAQLEALTS